MQNEHLLSQNEAIMPKESDLEGTKKLMGALLRQPPKQHDEMKVGKPQRGTPVRKTTKAPATKKATKTGKG